MIVSDRVATEAPLIIHNVGSGTKEEIDCFSMNSPAIIDCLSHAPTVRAIR